jgi:gliding motility-associated-like protein
VFRTLCDAFTVPFQEGFNSTSTTEACWTVLNVNGDPDAWNMNYATNPFEGDQVAILFTDANGTGANNNNDWLISPQIILTGNQRLRYRYRVQSAGEPNDFRVMLSENGPIPAQFTTTLVPLASYNNITYMEAIVNLSAYSGPVNIAWHVPPGGLDGWRLYIDNVIIEDLPTCPEPSMLTASAVLSTSATLTWTNGNAETEWQVLALPCGSPAPAAGATGFVTVPPSGSPYVLTGLTPTTCYDVYIRAVCPGPDESPWTGPATFTTQVAPPACGGQYIDAGGTTANYPNNSDSTVTICPTTPGDVVTVTFTSFDTEATWDGLYVFDGNSITAPQIASTNPAGNVPGGLAGSFWGTTIPGPFTSTSVDGCLTFRFRSDGFVNNPGWVANVTCAPAPTCRRPTALTSTSVTSTSVSLTWTQPANPDTSVASEWHVLALPCGSAAPSASSTGFVTATTNNSYLLTGLTPDTCYDIYIRAACSSTDLSEWAGPRTITTQIAPPVCGGTFTDAGGATANYPNNSDSTITICPTVTGEIVTVTFTSFNTEANWDALYVFDGNSIAAPQIASTNPAANVPGGLPGGYWGTTIPEPFTSSSVDGCLTFRFRSDGFVNNPGWVANVTCGPAPTCPRPTALTITAITETSAIVGWTEVGSATQWEVLVLPAGSPTPLPTDVGIITTTNLFAIADLQSATAYDVYVRAICATDDISLWSNKGTFRTLIENDACSTAINVPVNPDTNCVQFVSGTVIGATASPEGNTCGGTDDDDVWFSFVATAANHSINLNNVAGSTTDLFHVLYTGSCGALTQIYCSDPNSSIANNLVVGQTYYIRVYTWTATPNQTTTFTVCIGTIPPPISSSTTLYTNPQLVEEVLLNSTCATVSNVTSSTGSNFGSTNGIGYFNQNGSSFPFEEGVVLTTGNALSAPGPNTTILSDGNQAWTGDVDLEAAILAGTGNPMTSRNASKLEFDFVPIINTISFNFIFASEEYGGFQCDSQYSDAFAFLLTNTTTGVTTNLAVLPGTSVPISVGTIRNNLYNTTCPSVNSEYFGNYFELPEGENPIGAPINFNGMTVPLVASATVIPGQTYHIKLVIADRQDNLFDSAVFIEGGSFNIGTVDLGNDLLQQTNNAVCYGETQLLDSGLSSDDFTFTWMLGTDIIPNETGPSLVVTEPGLYTLNAQYNNTTCTATDTIEVEFYPEIIGGEANDLVLCGTNDVAVFDLTVNTPLILNGNNPNDYTVTYYLTQADAEAGVNPIANPTDYSNISNPQTIYYQLANAGGCFIIGNFDLIVQPLTDIVFNLPTQVCQNGAVPTLPTTSDNSISGTWTPAIVDNLQTQTYTFVASENTPECTQPYEITIEVLEQITPTFLAPAPICSGDVAPELPLTSNNGVTGTWSPNVVSNTQTQTYTFTPTNNPCATTTQIVVTVYQDCSFGSYANAVWLTDCDTNNFFNTVGSGASIIGPIENIFPNADLGTYVSNSSTLKLRGAEIKTFKVSTANVCSATLFYRIYPVSGTAGAFSSISLPFFEDCTAGTFPSGGPCTTGDQKWQEVLSDIENPIDLTAFPAGEYNLEIYYQLVGDVTSATECDDTLLIDNNGANFIATYTLQDTPTYTFVNPTNCLATDGSITIEGLAPSTSYSFTHTQNGATVGPNTIITTTTGSYILNGLSIGTYTNFNYLVNGCTITSTDLITLSSENAIQFESTNPTTCESSDGTITISGLLPTQSYNVTFNYGTAVVDLTLSSNVNGVITLTGLNAGTYSDFNLITTNCSSSSNQIIILVNPDAPTVTVTNSSICPNQIATVTATPDIPGTYNYVWTVPAGVPNPGNVASFTTNIAGDYTVVITPLGTSFCNGSFETPSATGIYPNMVSENLVTCWDTSAADGIIELWPSPNYENVVAYEGNNFIEMNGNSIDTFTQDFTTSPGAQLTISFAHRGRQGTDVVGVEIGPTGGSYVSLGNFSDGQTWALHNVNYTVPSSGGNNYTIRFVSISSAGGSTTVGNFLDAVSVTSVACSSLPTTGTVTLLPEVGLSLTSANNNQIVCLNTSFSTIDYSTTNATNVSVTGLPLGMTSNFDTANGNFTISGTATETGTFTYAVTATNDCNTVVLNGILTVNPNVTPTFTPITICNGDALTLPTTSLEGITGTWSPAVNNTATTTYTFTPNNPSQCGLSTTFTVNVNQPVVATFDPLPSICVGETAPSLPAISIEGFTGTWSPSTISNTASGTYTFTPAAGQCASVGTLNFVVNPLIVSTFTDISICQGETISFPVTSNENYTGTWSPNVIDNTQSGSYTFTPNAGQCATNGVWNVTVLPTFDFEITGSCVESNYTLEVKPLNNSFDLSTSNFTWYTSNLQMVGGNDATFNVSQYINSTTEVEEIPITFSVTVTNADGCFVSKPFTIDNVLCQIQKGISANGDGLNDSFELSGFNVKKLTIFNRLGMKVYSKNQYTNEWKGQSDSGDELPDATYFYVIEFNSGDEAKTGWIYINREN